MSDRPKTITPPSRLDGFALVVLSSGPQPFLSFPLLLSQIFFHTLSSSLRYSTLDHSIYSLLDFKINHSLLCFTIFPLQPPPTPSSSHSPLSPKGTPSLLLPRGQRPLKKVFGCEFLESRAAMFKQSLNRNHRSKGSRVKHALQVCLLVAVCIWLLYQVKHSHDKKKAMEERSFGVSTVLEESHAEILRFGRKDLPRVVETDEKTVTLNEDEVNEDVEEAEPEPERITKENEGEDDGRATGEDGIDENDREEADEEGENGEELENEEEKDEEKNGHSDEAKLLSDQEEDPKTDAQEAREEQYKGDDASSAVVRDGEIMTESEGMSSNDEEEIENVERDAKIVNSTFGTEDVLSEVNQFNASLEQGEIHLVNNSSMNETSLTVQEHESSSLTNSTALESIHRLEQQYNSTLDALDGDISSRNSTIGREIIGEDDSNSAEDSDSDRERDLIEEKEKSDMTDRAEDEDSNSAEEGDLERERDLIEEKEKADTTDKAEDEEDQNSDPLDSDDSSANISTVVDDERDDGTDVSTLPEVETESKNEDVAAE